MTLFSIPEAERRLALPLLGWEEEHDHAYAFAEKSEGVLLVSRSKALGGDVFEVDLATKTVRRIGGSGEFYVGQSGER